MKWINGRRVRSLALQQGWLDEPHSLLLAPTSSRTPPVDQTGNLSRRPTCSNHVVVLKGATVCGALDGYWRDECRGCHCCSGGGLFALVSQRQDVLLQVCDPLGLDRQRTLEDLVTEPAAKSGVFYYPGLVFF